MLVIVVIKSYFKDVFRPHPPAKTRLRKHAQKKTQADWELLLRYTKITRENHKKKHTWTHEQHIQKSWMKTRQKGKQRSSKWFCLQFSCVFLVGKCVQEKPQSFSVFCVLCFRENNFRTLNSRSFIFTFKLREGKFLSGGNLPRINSKSCIDTVFWSLRVDFWWKTMLFWGGMLSRSCFFAGGGRSLWNMSSSSSVVVIHEKIDRKDNGPKKHIKNQEHAKYINAPVTCLTPHPKCHC